MSFMLLGANVLHLSPASWVSVTASVGDPRRALCCISMVSHKSRVDEVCETAQHEKNHIAGGEMLAGLKTVEQPWSLCFCSQAEWIHAPSHCGAFFMYRCLLSKQICII
ncbi:hypothetical protein XENOCAPTIV_011899 [Xenoophorus captivus]|uniref:Secreted protein n=1 Tax=Xenoophorus captivus TaxID=1517983 RepID=A0ABV0QD50_9TELE